MNLYFVVEGRRTEKKVYPAWLGHLLPEITQVNNACEVNENNYYLFNGNGYPSLLHNHLKNSIDEVNDLKKFNYLILILDVDESSIDERRNEVLDFIQENNLNLIEAELVIILQNKCIETWFLGNKKIYKQNPHDTTLVLYNKFYNVRDNDPELMSCYNAFNTTSQFHSDYCTLFLRERNIRYSKNNPNGVTDKNYLESLIERYYTTNHLESFSEFINFCNLIKEKSI